MVTGSTSASSTTARPTSSRPRAGRTARWRRGGYRLIERFYLDGTTPVWHYACADTLIEKRVWMEPGANTTYVRYRLLRAGAAGVVRLELRALVNYREFHVTTRGPGWQMAVEGIKVTRPGLKVRYRSGFFGVTDEKIASAARPPTEQHLMDS